MIHTEKDISGFVIRIRETLVMKRNSFQSTFFMKITKQKFQEYICTQRFVICMYTTLIRMYV